MTRWQAHRAGTVKHSKADDAGQCRKADNAGQCRTQRRTTAEGGQRRTMPDTKTDNCGRRTTQDNAGQGRTEGGQRTKAHKSRHGRAKPDPCSQVRLVWPCPALSIFVRLSTHDTLKGWLRTEDEEKPDLEAGNSQIAEQLLAPVVHSG